MGSRFFRHGELPLVLLALLADRPMHAYDLMAELARVFAPHYRASPGSVYPAVEALEAEGLITAVDEEGPRVYGLSPVGEEALEKRRDALAAVELRTGLRLRQRRTIEAVLDRFSARVRALAARLETDELEQILDRTVALIEEGAMTEQVSDKGESR